MLILELDLRTSRRSFRFFYGAFPREEIVLNYLDHNGEIMETWYIDGREVAKQMAACEVGFQLVTYMGKQMCRVPLELLERRGLARVE